MEQYIGIDIGGTNISLGVVNEEYKILYRTSIKTPKNRPYKEALNDLAQLIKQTLSHYNNVKRIGVGCPGICDIEKGIVKVSNNLGWYNISLKDDIEKISKIPTIIENDANAAAYGEYIAGVAKDADSAVIITLGTGVGSGIIINGELFYGERYEGGEIGHMVIDINGPLCTCGRRGCFESFASIIGLIRLTEEALKRNPNSKMKELSEKAGKISARTSFDAARMGDIAAQNVVNKYIMYLACGIANTVNIFRPDFLCIGGGICNEGDNLLIPLRKAVKKQILAKDSDFHTKIEICTLGNDAGIIGASMINIKLKE